MADIQLHTHTQDIEITAPQTKDVVIGSPMDKGGVLPITKNGKYVVSDYDLAEVDVQPAVSDIKVTENGTYLPSDYDVDAFNKVEVQVDDTRRVMTEFIRNGGKLAYYTGTELPPIDWESLGYFDYTRMFINAKGKWTSSQTLYAKGCYAAFASYNTKDEGTISIDFSMVTNTTGMFENAVLNNLIILNHSNVQFSENFFKNTVINGYISDFDCGKVNLSLTSRFGKLVVKGEVGGFLNYGKNRIFSSSDYIDYWIFSSRDDYVRVFNLLYDLTSRGTFQYPPTIKCEISLLTDEDIKIATDKGWTVIQ